MSGGEKVQVWSLALACLDDAGWRRLEAVLDPEEWNRAERFRFAEDRASYVAAHGLLRLALVETGGRAATEWRFGQGEHGKPYPLDLPGGLDLRFNLSHTRGMVAVAVAIGMEVGVDVEGLGRRPVESGMIDMCLAPVERVWLDGLGAGEARQSGFLALWTLKEALLKAAGLGLGHSLTEISFALDPIRLSCPPSGLGDPAEWRFHQETLDGYLLALAVRRREPVMVIHRDRLPA